MQGILSLDYIDEVPSAYQQLATWQAEGKIWTDDKVIKGGFEAAEGALISIFKGANTGSLALGLAQRGNRLELI